MEKSENFVFRKQLQHVISKLVDALKLNDLMKLHEYQKSGSLFDLRQRSLHFQTYILFFSKTVEFFETKYHVKAEEKVYTTGLGHMTKMTGLKSSYLTLSFA